MKKIILYSILLIIGLAASQFLPLLLDTSYGLTEHLIRILTMTALSFIMIHVGYEFEVDKENLSQYGWDYAVAMTTAAFPWIFVSAYFVFAMLPAEFWASYGAWKEALLSGRFAAPTSAGVLFSMLAAAGLSASWLFRKARILAIFDDLDTVLLMIPLKVMMVGLVWQLGFIVVIVSALLFVGWVWLHRIRIPVSWQWVLLYSAIITGMSEFIYFYSKNIDDTLGIHIEVLLPAFVLGCIMARPAGTDPHVDDAREGHQEGPESPSEQRVSTIVAAVFVGLVGLSMPSIITSGATVAQLGPFVDESEVQFAQPHPGGEVALSEDRTKSASILAGQPFPGWSSIAVHVVVITLLSNLGKMFPLLCYRREAHWKVRLALAIGMWPRGEVGAGILVVSLSYGIGGPVLTTAMLSLSLNLVLTGLFILVIKNLIRSTPTLAMPATD